MMLMKTAGLLTFIEFLHVNKEKMLNGECIPRK